jgi:hypothetical protein
MIVVTVASVSSAGAASPGGGRIGPKQEFGALVNGKTGRKSPVVIRMGCPGAVKAGQTGHPVRGQTVPEDIVGTFGNTGAHGRTIWAFFGAPPPTAASVIASVRAGGGPVTFGRYRTKAIPTTEVLPCSGSGHVTFVPLPMSPGSEQDVVIPVRYVVKS